MPRKVTFQVDADTKAVQKGLKDAEQATDKLHSALDRFGPVGSGVANVLGKLGFSSVKAAAGVAGAAVAVGAAVKIAEDAVNQYTTLGDAVRRYSQVSGQSAEASTRQVFAFKELGIDADTVSAAMFKLARAADNAKDPLGAVGVNVARDSSGAVDLNATLLNVITAWQGTSDAAKQAAIIFAAFGRAGASMLPVLETNAAELRRLEAQVQIVFTAKDLEAIRKYKVAQNELKQSNDDLGLSIGRALLPAQTAAVESINENIYVNEHLSESTEYQTAVAHHNRVATMAVVEALRQQYRDSLTARDAQTQLAESMKQAAQAAVDEAAAVKADTDAVWAGVDANDKYRQAQLDFATADKAARDAKYQDKQLNIQATEATERLVQAAGDLAVQQQGVAGTTDEASVRTNAQIAELKRLEGTVKKGSPLWNELQGWIDILNAIPREVRTDITLSGAAFRGGTQTRGGHGLGFADGGTVPGPTGAPVVATVHGGEEIIPVGGRRGFGDLHLHFHDAVYADGPGLDRLTVAIAQRLRMVTGI